MSRFFCFLFTKFNSTIFCKSTSNRCAQLQTIHADLRLKVTAPKLGDGDGEVHEYLPSQTGNGGTPTLNRASTRAENGAPKHRCTIHPLDHQPRTEIDMVVEWLVIILVHGNIKEFFLEAQSKARFGLLALRHKHLSVRFAMCCFSCVTVMYSCSFVIDICST